MTEEPGYGEYIQLRDEADASSNVIKVKAMMIHPDRDGKKRGICEKITYNNEGVAIAWNYPKFVDFMISFTGTDYILTPVN
jgi:hypothetical protein